MFCPHCQGENEAEAAVCAHCGEALQAETRVAWHPGETAAAEAWQGDGEAWGAQDAGGTESTWGAEAPPEVPAAAWETALHTGELREPALPEPAPRARRPAAPGKPKKKGRPIHRFKFHGSGGAIFGMHVVNVLLTLLTLGIYSFWAKVKIRKYLFSQFEFRKQRFAYHGTGKELFIGRIKLLLMIGLPVAVVVGGAVFMSMPIDPRHPPVVLAAVVPLVDLFVVAFIPFAMVGSRRYLLSRTSWSGIRFSFRGSAREFFKIFFLGGILCGLTLGVYLPWYEANIYRFMTNHSYFGNRAFQTDVTGKLLIKDFLIALVLTPFTLGLVWIWYLAKRTRVYSDRTSFGKARFRSNVTAGKLFRLSLGNLFIAGLTFGLGLPWVQVRICRYMADNLVILGELGLDAIKQEALKSGAGGEAMAELLGLDVGLAI